jgi:hypothetical protein
MDFQAVMATDAAALRYRYYHTVADIPDKLDFNWLANVVETSNRGCGYSGHRFRTAYNARRHRVARSVFSLIVRADRGK